jgi:predicted RNA-binding Zn ribbon-like protein
MSAIDLSLPAAGELSFETQPEQPLCIQFVNTAATRLPDTIYDYLVDLRTFASWCRAAGLICDDAFADALDGEHAKSSLELLREARRLREELYTVFLAASDGRLGERDLAPINHYIGDAGLRPRLALVENRPRLAWSSNGNLRGTLSRIAVSAAETLAAGVTGRIIVCESPHCEWLAIDTSRNHSRRFCSSVGCGNRARARRFYRRTRNLPIG